MSQVKKISVATVYGKIKLSELIAAKTITVMRVVGVAVGVKTGTSDYGDWKCLMGTFKAVNPTTGEEFRAPQLFLPPVAMTPVEVALAQEGTRGVEFAVEVVCKYVAEDAGHKAGGSPYEYTWTPLLSAGADDPIARLEAKMAEHGKSLLPAPVVYKHAPDATQESEDFKNGLHAASAPHEKINTQKQSSQKK